MYLKHWELEKDNIKTYIRHGIGDTPGWRPIVRFALYATNIGASATKNWLISTQEIRGESGGGGVFKTMQTRSVTLRHFTHNASVAHPQSS
jgi:hypothetical protein